jgi:hypothetical protein
MGAAIRSFQSSLAQGAPTDLASKRLLRTTQRPGDCASIMSGSPFPRRLRPLHEGVNDPFAMAELVPA